MMPAVLRAGLLPCIVTFVDALSFAQMRSYSGDLGLDSISAHTNNQTSKSTIGDKVAWNDGMIGNPLVFHQLGWPYVDWTMCSVQVHSNLAGLGPDVGEESIRYYNIWTSSEGRGVDIVVTANSSYSANVIEFNGLVNPKSCFGQINIASDTSVELLFSFYLTGTNTTVAFEEFFFTIFDLDMSSSATESATYYSPASDLILNQDTELVQSGQFTDGLTLTATQIGFGNDNPKRPDTLNDLQRKRSGMVRYLNTHQLKVKFDVAGGQGGRNFIFSGHSNVRDTPAPTPPTPAPTEVPTPAPTPPTPAPTTCQDAGTCSIYEDPHIKVFDGMQISLLSAEGLALADYGSGDFWLVRSSDISIQARYKPDPDMSEDNLFVKAVAVGGKLLNGNTLILGPLEDEISWNGEPILESQTSEFAATLSTGTLQAKRHLNSHLVQDMTQINAGVDVDLPQGVKLTVNRYKHHVNLFIEMHPATGGQDGLCGNFNCNAADDALGMILANRDPKVQPENSLFKA